jgi:hypothetical protein
MEHIYSKVNPEVLLHTVFRIKELEDIGDDENKRVDITDVKEYLQCVLMKIEKNKTYKPHMHIRKPKIFPEFKVQEAFIVIVGRIRLDIYDTDETMLRSITLNAGDLAILLEGAHGLATGYEGAIIYEVKTGPYEGQVNDKKFIK